jgi:hypothetical protein
MAINLGKNYNLSATTKKTEKKPKTRARLSGPVKIFIQLSLWAAALILGFIVLSSSIISREAERSLVSEIYDNIVGLKQKEIEEAKNFLESEKELTTNIDPALSERLSGYILLQVESKGEAWYVYPEDNKKYFLGRPEDAVKTLKILGKGATHAFLNNTSYFKDEALGRIYLDTDSNGEAYYINPKDRQAYYLGELSQAYTAIKELGIGVSNKDIRKIEIGEIDSL